MGDRDNLRSNDLANLLFEVDVSEVENNFEHKCLIFLQLNIKTDLEK